jgi:hypothetical protein
LGAEAKQLKKLASISSGKIDSAAEKGKKNSKAG